MNTYYEVFPAEEWLYPDSAGGEQKILLQCPKNSYACSQILLHTAKADISFEIFADSADKLSAPHFFEILPVTVNKNSCFSEELDTERTSLEDMKKYYTKTAPFEVYDALKPSDGRIICRGKTTAVYIKWHIPESLNSGIYSGKVILKNADESIAIPYEIFVAKATVPESKKFRMINWIVPNPKHYRFEPFSERHWEVLKKINTLAAEAHQTHVSVNASFFTCVPNGKNTVFSFEYADRYIKLGFELGLKYIEGPNLKEIWLELGENASEKNFGDSICTEFLGGFLEQWYGYLQSNKLTDVTVQHIFDEPRDKNVHIYKMLGKLVKEKMPDVKTIDAVLTTNLDSLPDILIPTTRFYQLRADYFNKAVQSGRDLWLYTCCWPSAPYLNRFLDMPLLSVRYIHWLCYALNVSAYLHWGFCFQADCQDAFTEPSIPFKIFDDSLEQYLPPGDTNIIYVADGEPLGSVRLEMQRAGIEDFELLSQLDRETAMSIVNCCIRADFTADTSVALFKELRQRLLFNFEK